MKCTICKVEASKDASFCGDCGQAFVLKSRCRGCHKSMITSQKFCENCGLGRQSLELDNSFLEQAFKYCLGFVRRKGLGFTHTLMRTPARILGIEMDSWGAEEIAHLFALALTYILLALSSIELLHHWLMACLAALYVAYRLLDILSYELEIVFMDRHKDMASRGGHLLSVDRRVLCIFIRLLDFIGCYAVLFWAISTLQTCAFTANELDSPIKALYFSVIVASFTGLSAAYPLTAIARCAVISEIVLNFILSTVLFATVLGSLGQLTEMTPRPPRAPRIFARQRSPLLEQNGDRENTNVNRK